MKNTQIVLAALSIVADRPVDWRIPSGVWHRLFGGEDAAIAIHLAEIALRIAKVTNTPITVPDWTGAYEELDNFLFPGLIKLKGTKEGGAALLAAGVVLDGSRSRPYDPKYTPTSVNKAWRIAEVAILWIVGIGVYGRESEEEKLRRKEKFIAEWCGGDMILYNKIMNTTV